MLIIGVVVVLIIVYFVYQSSQPKSPTVVSPVTSTSTSQILNGAQSILKGLNINV